MDELQYAIKIVDNSVNSAFDNLDKRVNNSTKGMQGMESSAGVVFRGLAAGATIVTGALSTMVGVATGLWKVTADNIDAQAKLANSLGLTYSQYERLSYAAGMAGTSQEALNTGLRKLSLGLSQAISGVGPTADALRLLGLDAKDLANVPLDQAMAQIADAMKGVENSADRTAIAVNLFGRQGLQMLPLLNEDMKALGDEAERMGRTLSQVDLTAIDNAGDAFDRVTSSMSALTNRFVADLAPAIEVVAESLFGATESAGEFGGAGTFAADLVINSMGLLINVFSVVRGTTEVFTAALMTMGSWGADVFAGLVAAVNAFWQPFRMMINGWIEIHNLVFKDEKWPLLGDLDNAVDKSFEFARNLKGASDDLANQGASNMLAGFSGSADDAFMKRVDEKRAKAAEDAANNPLLLGGEAEGIKEAKEPKEKKEKEKKEVDWTDELNKQIEADAKDAALAQERFERKQAEADAYLSQIQQTGMSELELLALQNEEKQAKLGEMRQQELISLEEFNLAMEQLDADHQQKKIQTLLQGNSALQSVSKAFQEGQLKGTLSFFAQGLAGLAGHSRKIFEVQKVASIAQAALAIPETVMHAYKAGMMAGGPAGPAVGAAYAAVALATQLAQIRQISSTSYGGSASGGGSVASGGGSVASGGGNGGGSGGSSSSGPSRVIELGLAPDDSLFSGATVNAFMDRMVGVINDGGGKALLRTVRS